MSDVKVLFNPHRIPDVPGNGAPRAIGKAATEARHRLGEYLDAALMRPLFLDGEVQQSRVETALNTMTRAERVYLEIDMTERSRQVHSFDYDPLR